MIGGKWSVVDRFLAVSLAAFLVCAFLLTPAGLETRPLSQVKSLAWLGIFFVALLLIVAALVLLILRRRVAPVLAMTASILFVPVFLSDQTGLFSSLPPPAPVTAVEFVTLAVAVAVLVLAWRVYRTK